MKTLQMKINIPGDADREIRSICSTLKSVGHECFIVGGSVRDLILGREAGDFDLATDATPEKVTRLFKRVIPTGIKHGTVSLLFGQRQYEITTYRADGTYLDGRRPEEVRYAKTLEEDVRRRDFTVNGLAYDIERGEVIDHPGGLEDMERRLIRTIGDPVERFSEDGLRPYRACRLAARLGFTIDADTFEAIGKTLGIASMVSMERVRDELMKLLGAGTPSVGLEYMRTSGLMDLFLPELSACHGLMQNRFHLYDIYYHSLYSCDAAPVDEPVLRLGSLLHDLGKVPTRREGTDGDYTFYNHEVIGARMAKKIMRRLKFSNEDTDRVANLVVNHMFHYTDEWTDGAVRRFMRKVGMENLEDLLAIRMADRRGNGLRDGMPQPIKELKKRIAKIIEDANAITVKDLDINGHIIMEEFSVQPGRIIGCILAELLELVLDHPELNTRETLVEKAREIYNELKDREEFRR
jgi:tRNA nucleotidyltransferase (CCA-adding enzyme)